MYLLKTISNKGFFKKMPTISRKIETFSFHGRVANEPMDYGKLFSGISESDVGSRIYEYKKRVFAVPHFEFNGSVGYFVVYEGDAKSPLIFDAENNEERYERLSEHEYLVDKTHAVFDLNKRIFLVEYVKSGAKAFHLSDFIDGFSKQLFGLDTASFYLSPVISDNFVGEIARFQRIREASVRLLRPNFDWDDCHDNVGELAQESDAHEFEIKVNAARGTSIAQNRGLVDVIKGLVRQPLTSLKVAKITGKRQGEEDETTINTKKFVDHSRLTVRTDDDGHVIEDDVLTKLHRLLQGKQ